MGSDSNMGIKSSKENVKILIVTTPIRPIPTDYPPFGSLSVINALKEAGYSNVHFYDIDALRPSYDDALQKIIELEPDVLGISSVVSTAYGFAKQLSGHVKQKLPKTTIVLGGNLGASAGVILRKTGIDFVVNGEGERTIVDLMNCYLESGTDKNKYKDVKGILFLDNDKITNTGVQPAVGKESIYNIDWDILEKNSNINIFFPLATQSLLAESTFAKDPRIHEPHRRGKRLGTLVASKGCVARCTFCHRWDKGIRYVPVPVLMERIAYIVDKYNVGFVTFGDENFGTDKRWLNEFCTEIKKFDVLWRVSGMRVNCVSLEYLQQMRDAGCSAVYFGMETGSERMLQIMEKKVKLSDNYAAVKWIYESGLHTTVQLVLGMPGENNQTIKETSDFACYSATLGEEQNPLDMSINYAQALPGTPLYEYARFKGLVGSSVEEEEKYLLAISNRDANDEATSLPLTGLPKLITECWRPYLIAKAATTYINKYGARAYHKHLLRSQYFSQVIEDEASADTDTNSPQYRANQDTGYFNFPKEKQVDVNNQIFSKQSYEAIDDSNVQVDVSGATDTVRDHWEKIKIKNARLPGFFSLLVHMQFRVLIVRYPRVVYHLRFFLPLFVLIFDLNRNGFGYAVKLVKDYFRYRVQQIYSKGKVAFSFEYKSLRKIVNNDIGDNPNDSDAILPLRKGR